MSKGMLEGISGWTAVVITVVTAAAVIELIIPKSDMRKYVKFVMGLLVISAMLEPLGGISEIKLLSFQYEMAERGEHSDIEQKERLRELFKVRLEQAVRESVGADVLVEIEEDLSIREAVVQNVGGREPDEIIEILRRDYGIGSVRLDLGE